MRLRQVRREHQRQILNQRRKRVSVAPLVRIPSPNVSVHGPDISAFAPSLQRRCYIITANQMEIFLYPLELTLFIIHIYDQVISCKPLATTRRVDLYELNRVSNARAFQEINAPNISTL